MPDNKYIYPVKRQGNEKKPKLIILLANPGDSVDHYKRFPEYVMDKDGFYKDSGMHLDSYRVYCKWWDTVLSITDSVGISAKDVLALEFYPYHTAESSDIPKQDTWDKYAKTALQENLALFNKHIKNKVPVFVYYKVKWKENIENEFGKELLQTNQDIIGYSSSRWQNVILKDLKKFLVNVSK